MYITVRRVKADNMNNCCSCDTTYHFFVVFRLLAIGDGIRIFIAFCFLLLKEAFEKFICKIHDK